MSTNIKLNCLKGEFLGNMMSKLGEKTPVDLAEPSVKDVLPKLVTKATLAIWYKFEKNISRQGAVRPGKRSLYLFICLE